MKHSPARPGYSGTPLSRKLGITPGMKAALIGAPPGFAQILGELPRGAKLQAGARGRPGLVIWFVKSTPELEREIHRISGFGAGAPLWIAWRKKTALRAPEVHRAPGKGFLGPSEREVREAGLAAGLVDYKVCAIDATWSGLLFAPRRNESIT